MDAVDQDTEKLARVWHAQAQLAASIGRKSLARAQRRKERDGSSKREGDRDSLSHRTRPHESPVGQNVRHGHDIVLHDQSSRTVPIQNASLVLTVTSLPAFSSACAPFADRDDQFFHPVQTDTPCNVAHLRAPCCPAAPSTALSRDCLYIPAPAHRARRAARQSIARASVYSTPYPATR
ncbi:hypothetical protein BD414DRAFT_481656 [Trametes punicea]|nr:hypothetical protein BD414DRAFT_481656 [Trametes punicea]